jgi:hypothetical protein
MVKIYILLFLFLLSSYVLCRLFCPPFALAAFNFHITFLQNVTLRKFKALSLGFYHSFEYFTKSVNPKINSIL